MLLAGPAFAGPKYNYQDPHLNDEMDNIYKEATYPVWINAKGSTATVTYLKVSTMSVLTEVIQVSTINALSMNSHKITGLANGTASTDAAAFGQIKIFQIVQSSNTTRADSTTTSYGSTNLTASITPSDSAHKILAIAAGSMSSGSIQNLEAAATIFRDSTDLASIASGQGPCSITNGSTNISLAVPCILLLQDSPASTSALTYTVKIKLASGAGTVTWNRPLALSELILIEYQ